MKKLYLRLLFIPVLAISYCTSYGQELNADSLIQRFKNFRKTVVQEKLYVHLDRNTYLTGEHMWFSAYAVDATLHHPDLLSKVMYVELLNEDNKPLLQSAIELSDSHGNGSFFIPATLPSGTYVLRAYTQWMRNFPAEYFYHRSVSIINPFIRLESSSSISDEAVGFFPEGGNLVAGIPSKVGFKISNGKPGTSYKLSIINSHGETLTSAEPFRFGLGQFSFTPLAGESYKCILSDSRNLKKEFSLPSVYREGYAMNVIDSIANKVIVKIKSTGIQNASAFVLIHCRQMIIHAEKRVLGSEESVFEIERNKIPDGVTNITVFDDNLNPVCERLIFTRPKTKLSIALQTDKASYEHRQKVTLQIQSAINQKPATANMSVSVYEIDSLGSDSPIDILSHLMLASDLNGFVESPQFYLTDDPAAKVATENLLLTHGWRRFDWGDVKKNNHKFLFLPEYRTQVVMGHVSKSDGTPAPGVQTYLSTPSKLIWLSGAISNDQGKVVFQMPELAGLRKLYFQTKNKADSLNTLTIDTPFHDKHVNIDIPELTLSPETASALKSRSFAMQVQDIYSRDEQEGINAIGRNDSTAFYGQPDEQYYLDKYTRFPILEEVLREYVPSVFVRKRRDGFHLMLIDDNAKANVSSTLEGDPLVMLDGVPVKNIDKLVAFDARKIKKVEVISKDYYLGSISIPGIVSFSSYHGDLAGFEMDPGTLVVDFEGLQMQRQFYSPEYDTEKDRNNSLPDRRTSLYWQPLIQTSNDGNALLQFYTSDVKGKFIAIVEGITDSGYAGTGLIEFRVQQSGE